MVDTRAEASGAYRSEPARRGQRIVWFLIALAYALAFAQRVSPQTLVGVMQREFASSAADLGLLASGYFYGYMLMQVPAGILVDVLGVRRAMVGSLAVSAVGTVLFAVAPTLTFAFAARVSIACSDALVFVALLKYVAQNFTDRQFGLISGLSQLSGYLGGIAGTLPLAVTVAAWGWRPSFLGIAALIAVNCVLIWLWMPIASEARGGTLVEFRASVAAAFARMLAHLRTLEAWGSALCFTTYFVAAMSLSGVWGFAILMHGFGLPNFVAAIVMSLVLAGTMLGLIAGGYLADRLTGRVRGTLVLCSAIRALTLVALVPAIGLGLGTTAVEAALVLFGLIGGATLPFVFRTLKQIYAPEHIGIGTAINSSVGGICAALLQPAIGWIIDLAQRPDAGVWASHDGYDLVALVFVLTSLPGLVAPFWLRPLVPPEVSAEAAAAGSPASD